jgi:hypothetical protein
MNYLYKTTIHKNLDYVIGVNAQQNQLNLTDFEANHKNNCIKIDGLLLAESVYEIDLDFADFETLIATPLGWQDIKYMEVDNKYILILLTEALL